MEKFIETLTTLIRKWPIIAPLMSLTALAPVNIAGLSRQVPTATRQLLDPSFFINHIASLSISLAYALLLWRLSSVSVAVVLSMIQAAIQKAISKFGQYMNEATSRSYEDIQQSPTSKSFDVFNDIISTIIGLIVALITFSFSHFGLDGFASLSQFMILLAIIAFLYVGWQFLTRTEAFTNIFGKKTNQGFWSATAAEWMNLFSKNISEKKVVVMKSLMGFFFLSALFLSFYLGELRMVYLTTQDDAIIQIGDDTKKYKIIGSTSSGVIAAKSTDKPEFPQSKIITFSYFPYDGVTYVTSQKEVCPLVNSKCVFELASNFYSGILETVTFSNNPSATARKSHHP